MPLNEANYQDTYIDLLLSCGVLRFGEFKTKSGRLSPYFFNTGHFDSGERLAAVADVYAFAIERAFGRNIDGLFGPAYKGIPLAVMTAERLAHRIGRDVSFTFNRKEAKDHGEGGALVGRAYQGGERIVVIEDVITGGTSFGETLPLLQRLNVKPIGLIVGVDRQERGQTPRPALQEISEQWGIPAAAIVSVTDILSKLHNKKRLDKVWIDDQAKNHIDAYLSTYGGVKA